jgi:predicted HNH restriction endonuclease
MTRDRAIVHHLEKFHTSNGDKRVSTVNDVRVVCADCHYVIHLTTKPLDVDALRSRIERSWTRWNRDGVSRRRLR